MDAKLLDILCCPVTLKPLAELPADKLASLNAVIGDGGVSARGGDQVSEPLQGALITDDKRLVYPVRDGVPVLLEEAGIDLASLQDLHL